MALEKFQPLLEYNPYHDARGRFTGSGGAKTIVRLGHGGPRAGRGSGWAKALERRYGAGAVEGARRGKGRHAEPMSRADSFGTPPPGGHQRIAGLRAQRKAAIARHGSVRLAQPTQADDWLHSEDMALTEPGHQRRIRRKDHARTAVEFARARGERPGYLRSLIKAEALKMAAGNRPVGRRPIAQDRERRSDHKARQ